jgi:hypothetical protein
MRFVIGWGNHELGGGSCRHNTVKSGVATEEEREDETKRNLAAELTNAAF